MVEADSAAERPQAVETIIPAASQFEEILCLENSDRQIINKGSHNRSKTFRRECRMRTRRPYAFSRYSASLPTHARAERSRGVICPLHCDCLLLSRPIQATLVPSDHHPALPALFDFNKKTVLPPTTTFSSSSYISQLHSPARGFLYTI